MDVSQLLDRPIAYHRAFVTITGSVTAAVMLSQAVYWARRCDDSGWFFKTQSEWEDETGLTRREQETARKALLACGAMSEVKKGIPAKIFYRVNFDAIGELLANKDGGKRQPVVAESANQSWRNAPNIHTEITTETTTENDCAGLPAIAAPAKDQCETETQAACRATWAAYSQAYLARYGTEPLRNAKINGQIKQLVQRLGAAEAPQVSAYYLTISDAYLVRRCHDMGSLVAQAESYRTQWATGRRMTQAAAQQADQTSSNANAAQEAIRMLREREGRQ